MRPYHSEWHDMSDYVVHFTRPSGNSTAYDNIISILGSQVLQAANPFGVGRQRSPNVATQHTVNFSEIPLHLIDRLAKRRGKYGVGFSKQFLLERGGGPIWYVEKDSASAVAIQQLMLKALKLASPEEDPVWRITPFIDIMGDYSSGSYRFEWEREWRHIGNVEFSEEDPAFLVIPEELHVQARSFFEDAYEEHTGPAYFCPYIDPQWTPEQIRYALSTARKDR